MTDKPTPRKGQPILFKNGIVLTMDDSRTVLNRGDVLVKDGRIAEVGVEVDAPEDAFAIDAEGGIVMPAWWTRTGTCGRRRCVLRRRLDADAVLRLVLPAARYEVPPAGRGGGNLISALDAVESGVTRASTGRTAAHRRTRRSRLRGARDLPRSVRLRIRQPRQSPWEWTADPLCARCWSARGTIRACSALRSPSMCRIRTRTSRVGGLPGGRGTRPCRDHPRGRVGATNDWASRTPTTPA